VCNKPPNIEMLGKNEGAVVRIQMAPDFRDPRKKGFTNSREPTSEEVEPSSLSEERKPSLLGYKISVKQ